MTLTERKNVLAGLILRAQDGYLSAIAFLFGEGGKEIAEDLGVPYSFVLTLALSETE